MAKNKTKVTVTKVGANNFYWTVEVFVKDMDMWFVYCDGFEDTEEKANEAANECAKYAKQARREM